MFVQSDADEVIRPAKVPRSMRSLQEIKTEVTPGNKGRRWSCSEDILLLEAHREFGSSWADVSKKMNGRSHGSVKKRFSYICSRETMRIKAELGLPEAGMPQDSRRLATAESKLSVEPLGPVNASSFQAGGGPAGESSGSSSVGKSDVSASARCVVSQAWLDILEMKKMGIRESSLKLTTLDELADFLEL
ncbi:hypothetical protein R1sor_001779 [Riccia sorocarpa]|uniref:Myb-like domain-containing protein n=1 Tax=Riccia sorocarpa TaxID=122646 RepID=A0ABD3GZE9_9MARC